MGQLLDVDCYDFDGGRVVAPRGELDASTCSAFAAHLSAPPDSLLVVDLFQLTFIDSSGLGAICAARQTIMKEGGHLVLSRPTSMVSRVLEITGLDIWVTQWEPRWSTTTKEFAP
jgi:anti-sigma B factor antagonist